MSAIARFATSRPTVCAVCRRTAWHLGYRPHDKAKLIWLCDSNECHKSAKVAYTMPAAQLDLYEKKAMREAGAEAGAFLDEIGTTDMAKLSEGQWYEFLRRYTVGFEKHLREAHLSNAAPF